MGPAVGASFFSRLTALTPASQDQDHPRVILLSDPAIPDRTTAIKEGVDTVSAQLRDGIEQLISWGADVIAVPCNTAHYFLHQFAHELSVPLISIIDAEIREAKVVAEQSANRAWLTCTTGTLATGLYQDAAERYGLELRIPDDDVFGELMEIIGDIKAGRMDVAGERAHEVYSGLTSIEDLPLLTACTELPLAYAASGLPATKEVSSIDALARAVLRAIDIEPLR